MAKPVWKDKLTDNSFTTSQRRFELTANMAIIHRCRFTQKSKYDAILKIATAAIVGLAIMLLVRTNDLLLHQTAAVDLASKYAHNLAYRDSHSAMAFGREIFNVSCLRNTSQCCNQPVTRPSQALTRHGAWQYTQDILGEVIVYSAFYDERFVDKTFPSIQILAVTNLSRNELFCHVWYTNVSFPYIVATKITKTGIGGNVNQIHWGQSQLTCPLPAFDPIPSYVSISTTRCGTSTILLPVQVMTTEQWPHEFGICVAIGFGTIPTTEFIEWIEMNRLLGVAEFNIYDGMMEEMSAVFDYYQQAGILRVHRMPPPVNASSVHAVKLSSPASLNDCMMRNMYRYKYVLVVDFDELIIPRAHRTYHELLSEINIRGNRSEPSHSYSIPNAYFFREISPDPSQPSFLRTMRYRKRAPTSGKWFVPKSFINPRRCFSVFNHWCYISFPNSGPAIDVDKELALSHHYRKCEFGDKNCHYYFNHQYQDDTVLAYKPLLESRVRQVMHAVNISIYPDD